MKPTCITVESQTKSLWSRVPVLASDAIYDRNPDCIVIWAWPYAAPIVSKHQRFLDSGGQFIVPLPTAGIYQPVSSAN